MDAALKPFVNLDLSKQIDLLDKIVTKHEILNEVIKRTESLALPDYYIGAGCIAQTVWNDLCGYPLDYGITDIDIIYFDNRRKTFADEIEVNEQVQELFKDIPFKIDLVNQARVHEWYQQAFGFPIPPYKDVESAIRSWPTTATAIGVRKPSSQNIEIYAPFGLHDLFGMIVRANKQLITKEIYEGKVAKWQKKWPELTIVPWDK